MLNKKIKYFIYDEFSQYTKSIILFLPTDFFKITKITLDSNISEREREVEIEEILEEKFYNYNSFFHYEKEIILSKDEYQETIIIVSIEKEKLNDIIKKMDKNKISLYGVYPLFLIEFFNTSDENKIVIDYYENSLYIFEYEKYHLSGFLEIYLSYENIEGYLIENYNNTNIISLEKNLNFSNCNYINLEEYRVSINKNLDFLPKEYLQNKLTKKLLTIFLYIGIFFSLLLLGIFFYLSSKLNDTYDIIQQNNMIISKHKNEIKNLENIFSILNEENKELFKELSFSKEKPKNITPILYEIFMLDKNLQLKKLEFLDNKLIISGKFPKDKNFYLFLTKLYNMDYLKFKNQDFIRLENNFYNFKMEFEIISKEEE